MRIVHEMTLGHCKVTIFEWAERWTVQMEDRRGSILTKFPREQFSIQSILDYINGDWGQEVLTRLIVNGKSRPSPKLN